MYIPYFKQHIASIRPLASMETGAGVSELMTEEHQLTRKDMALTIIDDPCITL